MLHDINALTYENMADCIQVYDAEIKELLAAYLAERCGGDLQEMRERAPALLLYLADNIGQVDLNNIAAINYLFTVYVHICAETLDRLPTLGMFGIMSGIGAGALEAWEHGRTRSRAHQEFASKAKEYCKALVIDKLSNKSQADVNLIFISKAAYGLRETAPAPAPETERLQAIDSIAEELGIDAEEMGALPGE